MSILRRTDDEWYRRVMSADQIWWWSASASLSWWLCSRVAAECRSGSIREMKWNDASNETHRTHRSDERSTNDVYTVNSQVYVRLTNTNTLQCWRDSFTVGTISNVETSYFTQLKICYLMTTFRCPSDILIVYSSMEHVSLTGTRQKWSTERHSDRPDG